MFRNIIIIYQFLNNNYKIIDFNVMILPLMKTTTYQNTVFFKDKYDNMIKIHTIMK